MQEKDAFPKHFTFAVVVWLLAGIVAIVSIGIVAGLYDVVMRPQRSVSIPLGDSGKLLLFTAVWGWSMEQQLSIVSGTQVITESEKERVWKTPANAGGPVYRDSSGLNYVVFLHSGLFRVDTITNHIEKLCDRKAIEGLAHIGNFFADMGSPRESRGNDVAFSDEPDFKIEQPVNFSPCG